MRLGGRSRNDQYKNAGFDFCWDVCWTYTNKFRGLYPAGIDGLSRAEETQSQEPGADESRVS